MDQNNTKDKPYLGEIDVDHSPQQTFIVKPTIVTPTNQNIIQNINESYSVSPEIDRETSDSTNVSVPNIDNQAFVAANSIVNEPVNTNLPPLSTNSRNTSGSLYSTDPSEVKTDLTQNTQTPYNPNLQSINSTSSTINNVDKPIYGGVIDQSKNQYTVTNKPPYKKSIFKNKKFYIIGASALATILIISGIIFGVYLPNTPENTWNTGLSRTGKQTTAVIDSLADPKAIEALKKTQIEASGTINNKDITYNLSANSLLDSANSDTTSKVQSTSNSNDQDFTIDTAIKTHLPENAILPNIYFKAGFSDPVLLQSFGLSEQYNNSWISIEQDYINSFIDSYGIQQSEASEISAQDVIDVIKQINNVSQQYIFASDPNYSVIVKKSFVGKEKIDDKNTNLYKASINKDNAKKYCSALVETLMDNESYKKIALSDDNNIEAKKQEEVKSCNQSVDEIPDNFEFDMWINKSVKIIQRIRVYDDLSKQNKVIKERKAECLQSYETQESSFCDYADDLIEEGQRYIEFGQVLKSKKEIVLYTSYVSDTNKERYSARAEISANSDTYEINGKINANIGESDNQTTVDLSIKATTYDGQIDSYKPQNSIPIEQVLKNLNNFIFEEQ